MAATGFGKQDPERDAPQGPGVPGGLAQRLQEGVRATIDALTQSHAQQLADLVQSSDDAIMAKT